MTIPLNADVRARLDAHLDAVEKALMAAGNPRERRRGVVDDLEAQILDMLAEKSEAPTVADLEGVLAGLDPPTAYGEAAIGVPMQPPAPVVGTPAAVSGAVVPVAPKVRYSLTAIWGVVCILVSLLPVPVVVLGIFFLHSQGAVTNNLGPTAPAWVELQPSSIGGVTTAPLEASRTNWKSGIISLPCIILPVIPFALLGTILGWIAFGQIRSSNGTLRGKGLALFDGLFYVVPFATYVGMLVLTKVRGSLVVILGVVGVMVLMLILIWKMLASRKAT